MEAKDITNQIKDFEWARSEQEVTDHDKFKHALLHSMQDIGSISGLVHEMDFHDEVCDDAWLEQRKSWVESYLARIFASTIVMARYYKGGPIDFSERAILYLEKE